MTRRLLPALTILSLTAALAQAGLTSITIVNPSFNADSFGGVGYADTNGGVVTGWSINNPTGMGITGTDQPGGAHFIDGQIVDGNRAGFIQGAGAFSQNLSGFTPGQRYVFQGWFRPRNCCGDSPSFSVSMGGQPLVSSQVLSAGSPWQAFSVPFTASSATNLLSISSAAAGGGDASLALDNIQVFQLDADYVNILNPSFESGIHNPFPGYQGAMAGWSFGAGTGGAGYNYGYTFADNSAFADNGTYPEGNTVGFIQNTRTLSQLLTVVPGQLYQLEFDYNTRAATTPGYIQVALGGTMMLDTPVAPVGGTNAWNHFSGTWTAGSTTASLDISGIQQGSDSAITFDNFTLRAIPEPSAAAAALAGLAVLGPRRRR